MPSPGPQARPASEVPLASWSRACRASARGRCMWAADGGGQNSTSSRAQLRRLAQARRHGELFPLPLPGVDPRSAGGPHYAQQRARRREQLQGQVCRTVGSLNRLAAATSSDAGLLVAVPPSRRRPTAVQSAAVSGVEAEVRAAGPCPKDLDGPGALRELLSFKGLYAQEPLNLAPIQPREAQGPSRRHQPEGRAAARAALRREVPRARVLPDRARQREHRGASAR